MKKKAMVCALGFYSLALQAGGMGPVSSNTNSVPYLSTEGTHTWNGFQGYTINGSPTAVSKNGWGGRLAAGIDRPYTEHVSLNAEIGGGYYGSTKFSNTFAGIRSLAKISGYDVLAGGAYHAKYFDIFGDVGFMSQTLLTTMERNYSQRIPGGVFNGQSTEAATQTHVMPEIKVGAAYRLRDDLSLTLSYLHAFGSTISGNIYALATDNPPTTIGIGGKLTSRNPSLDSILLGLRYHFV